MKECTPKAKVAVSGELRCSLVAPKGIVDDWGDSCEGYKCLGIAGHSGNCMASDGANGYVYFKGIPKDEKPRYVDRPVIVNSNRPITKRTIPYGLQVLFGMLLSWLIILLGVLIYRLI